jgi:hypothetical protein
MWSSFWGQLYGSSAVGDDDIRELLCKGFALARRIVAKEATHKQVKLYLAFSAC